MKTYNCPECGGKMNANNFANVFRCRLCDLVLEENALGIIKRLTSERDDAQRDAIAMAQNSNMQMLYSDNKNCQYALKIMAKYGAKK